MAASSDSEEENFVELGEPLPFITGDGNKKPIALQAAPSKENKGHPRFHGAFTGGFSAGYFNTVGTKEGWAPSTFVSSRSKKHQLSDQRPEDFMDEEDLGEHGIAPRKLVTSDAFTSEERNRKRHSDMIARTRDTLLPVTPALIDLIVPERLPIGIKLLRKMGWKEGQGIGPRQKAKKPKRQKTPVEPGVKIYGCALPPLQDGSENEMSDSDVDLQNVTFAPKDVAPIKVISKDNVFGLGYHGLDPTVALPSTHISLFEPPTVRSSRNRKGIRGQAFGVGALEEEDEDIYAVDSLSNYDQTMEINDDQHFGWTAPGSRKNIEEPLRSVNFLGKLLEGFTVSAKLLPQKKVFSPPTLPSTFRPFHRIRKTAEQLAQDAVGDTSSNKNLRESYKQTAVDRGLLLGEIPIASSVFDLIPKADIKRMEAIKEAAKMTAKRMQSSGKQDEKSFLAEMENSSGLEKFEFSGNDPVLQSPAVGSTAVSSTSSEVLGIQLGHHHAQLQCLMPDEGREQVPVFQGSLSFKPFRKDPAKQGRYDKYVAFVKQGVKDPYEQVVGSHMTEWEKQREREEFSKAAMIYRPLSSMMASRFTRGSFIDDAEQTARPAEAEGEKSEHVKAAEMKMYGQLTRKDMEWHPHNLLCKRFNVPNPYPGSETVGLLTVKRDKLSVFNFLSFPMDGSNSQNTQQKKMPKAIEESPSTKDLDAKHRRCGAMSIFSVLEDHAPSAPESVADNVDVNDGEDQQDKENEEMAQPTDLFRAIFKNSDSESSTSDEKSDDEIDKNEKENVIKDKSADPSGDLTFVAMLLSSQSGKQASADLVPDLEEQAKPSQHMVAPVLNLRTSPTLPASVGSSSHRRVGSRWGRSIFDVLDDSPSRQPQLHQQSTSETDLEQRLSASSHPSAEDDCYGPALPPTPITSTDKGLSVPTGATIGMTCKSHRKQKHRHKEDQASPQHHHKNKGKKKKSKHKKKKKKTEREKKDSSLGKRQRNHDKSSASEADADSELDSSS